MAVESGGKYKELNVRGDVQYTAWRKGALAQIRTEVGSRTVSGSFTARVGIRLASRQWPPLSLAESSTISGRCSRTT